VTCCNIWLKYLQLLIYWHNNGVDLGDIYSLKN
jgi:hypothetical protein